MNGLISIKLPAQEINGDARMLFSHAFDFGPLCGV
jgi:hypothetical protein